MTDNVLIVQWTTTRGLETHNLRIPLPNVTRLYMICALAYLAVTTLSTLGIPDLARRVIRGR